MPHKSSFARIARQADLRGDAELASHLDVFLAHQASRSLKRAIVAAVASDDLDRMRNVSPHDLLGVHPSASSEEIQKAYRAKAMQYHPDRHGDDLNAVEAMKLMNSAYEHLNKGTGASKPSGNDFHRQPEPQWHPEYYWTPQGWHNWQTQDEAGWTSDDIGRDFGSLDDFNDYMGLTNDDVHRSSGGFGPDHLTESECFDTFWNEVIHGSRGQRISVDAFFNDMGMQVTPESKSALESAIHDYYELEEQKENRIGELQDTLIFFEKKYKTRFVQRLQRFREDDPELNALLSLHTDKFNERWNVPEVAAATNAYSKLYEMIESVIKAQKPALSESPHQMIQV